MKLGIAPVCLGVAAAACSSQESSAVAPPPPPPATTADAGSDAPPVVPPYPAGPYGIGLGQVMPDIAVQGYRMTRDDRDASTLPFETIKLAEVRADATCENVLVLWDWAGAILSCTEMRAAVVALVAKDPTYCVLEVVAHAANSIKGNVAPWDVPPTRADVDETVKDSHEPFAVGMSSFGVREAGLEELPFFPVLFVMKKSDMRVAAVIEGAGDTEARIKNAIATRPPITETVATGLDHPQGLFADEANAYLYDATLGVVRVPVAGGSPTSIAKPNAAPSTLAEDATYIYWSTNASGTSEIARAPKAGGPTETLTTGQTGYTSIAPDGTTLWLTRTDGFVGSIATSGGAETPLATGEAAPSSVSVSASDVYWLAGGDLFSMPKTGGAKTTVLRPSDVQKLPNIAADPSSLTFSLLGNAIRGGALNVRVGNTAPSVPAGGAVLRFPIGTSTYHTCEYPYPVEAIGYDPAGNAWLGASDDYGGVVMVVDTDGKFTTHPALDFGQRHVGGVTLTTTHGYWTDYADGKSAVLRRIALP
jgi:hypothetical protein